MFREMAHLSEESSNALFETLSQWNQVLTALFNPVNDPDMGICGVAT